MTDELSIQERYAPHNACFGCGPANELGLRIRSFPAEDGTFTAEWTASPHHEAFPGVLNGGIIGALLDCHSNWAAAYHLMKKAQVEQVEGESLTGTPLAPPCTVTADFAVKLLRPTPTNVVIKLKAKVSESTDDRAVIDATLEANGKVCATCKGTFVAVKPGHPAYHRW